MIDIRTLSRLQRAELILLLLVLAVIPFALLIAIFAVLPEDAPSNSPLTTERTERAEIQQALADNNVAEARRIAQSASEQSTSGADEIRQLIQICQTQTDWNCIINAYDELAELEGNTIEVNNGIAVAAENAGYSDLALQRYEAVLIQLEAIADDEPDQIESVVAVQSKIAELEASL